MLRSLSHYFGIFESELNGVSKRAPRPLPTYPRCHAEVVGGWSSRMPGWSRHVPCGMRACWRLIQQENADEWATGVAMVRGWARTRALVGGRREGGVTAVLTYLLRRRKRSTRAQYLFVAMHAEGRAAVREAVAGAGSFGSPRR